jgi:hypothetical protein
MLKSTLMIDSNSTYHGTVEIEGVVADQWECIGSVNGVNNYAATTTDDRRPVAFWELHNNETKRWDFQLDTFSAGPPDAALFAVPEGCRDFCPLF